MSCATPPLAWWRIRLPRRHHTLPPSQAAAASAIHGTAFRRKGCTLQRCLVCSCRVHSCLSQGCLILLHLFAALALLWNGGGLALAAAAGQVCQVLVAAELHKGSGGVGRRVVTNSRVWEAGPASKALRQNLRHGAPSKHTCHSNPGPALLNNQQPHICGNKRHHPATPGSAHFLSTLSMHTHAPRCPACQSYRCPAAGEPPPAAPSPRPPSAMAGTPALPPASPPAARGRTPAEWRAMQVFSHDKCRPDVVNSAVHVAAWGRLGQVAAGICAVLLRSCRC